MPGCHRLKDPERNGNRLTGTQVIDPMATDPLALWTGAPGTGRSQPPVSHADVLAGQRAWADRGMPCPL